MTEGTELVVVPTLDGEQDALVQAQHVEIDGPETMELAIETREGIRTLLREIDEAFRPHIARAHTLHRGLCDELRSRTAVPMQALALLDRKISDYEVGRRVAEEAERRRVTDLALREALERREATAQALADTDPAEAASVRQTPVEHFTTAISLPPSSKPKGVAVTVSYVAELTDLKALVEFALAHPMLIGVVLAPNQSGLDALVKQQGEGFNIPGVKRVPKAPVVRSTRR